MAIVSERHKTFHASGGTAYALADLINQMSTTDDPEVVAMFEDAVEEAREGFKEYVEVCIDHAKELELTIDSIDAEIARLRELKQQRQGRAERLLNSVKRYCELVEVNEMVTSLYTIKMRKNPPSVEIEDSAIIPREYMNEKVTLVPNKKLIAEHIKQGVVVDGARLIINTRLEVK